MPKSEYRNKSELRRPNQLPFTIVLSHRHLFNGNQGNPDPDRRVPVLTLGRNKFECRNPNTEIDPNSEGRINSRLRSCSLIAIFSTETKAIPTPTGACRF